MIELAPDVFQIPLVPRDGIHAYLVGDVLVDAGIKGSAKKVLAAVEGRTVRAHAITHAHVDHVGGSKPVVDALGVPFWCGAADAPAVRAGEGVPSANPIMKRVPAKFGALEPARELREGDELTAGFTVLDVPGHSPGHVAFWRASDGVLIAGDVFTNMSLFTTVPGLHLPPDFVTVDPALNRESARKVAALGATTVGFGHGAAAARRGPQAAGVRRRPVVREIARDVHHIPLTPRDGINAYLVGDVLVDAGLKGNAKRLLAALEGRRVRALALTHAHLDHAGGAQKVTDARRIPYWVGARDAQAADRGEPEMPMRFGQGLADFVGGFDGLQVDRELHEGDELAAGFVVLDTPGHSPGHVSYWRQEDRVLLCGDVLNGMHLLTSRPGLHLPPRLFTPDPAVNRASAQRLADLAPDVVGFGHGPVLSGAAPKLAAFLSK